MYYVLNILRRLAVSADKITMKCFGKILLDLPFPSLFFFLVVSVLLGDFGVLHVLVVKPTLHT